MRVGVFTVGLPDLTPEEAVRYDGWLVVEDFSTSRGTKALRRNFGFARDLLGRTPASEGARHLQTREGDA